MPIQIISSDAIYTNAKCSASVSGGGDSNSQQLTITNPPAKAVSFVFIFYDTTASFTHWGLYNIPIHRSTTQLPLDTGKTHAADKC